MRMGDPSRFQELLFCLSREKRHRGRLWTPRHGTWPNYIAAGRFSLANRQHAAQSCSDIFFFQGLKTEMNTVETSTEHWSAPKRRFILWEYR